MLGASHIEEDVAVNQATLEHFRQLAEALDPAPKTWAWVGPRMSQRMFGITEQRAKEYAERFGGEAYNQE